MAKNILLILGLLFLMACDNDTSDPQQNPPQTVTPTSIPEPTGRIILRYDYGNQVLRSALEVRDDGRIKRIETACCPPTDEVDSSAKLAPNELHQLLVSIDAAAHGQQSHVEGRSTSLGSSSGYLRVYSVSGSVVNIRTIKRNERVDGLAHDQVKINLTPEARAIEDFVNQLVDVDMYR
jgi:hypothetical protein